MRFDYGEKKAHRLEIARDIASTAAVLDSPGLTLNASLWGFYDDQQKDPMGILATRSGILSTASSAYVTNQDVTFKTAARHLISRGKDLVDLVQRPCVPGIELCLAILLGVPEATGIANAIVSLPANMTSHPEDAKAIILAMVVLGQKDRVCEHLKRLPAFERLYRNEKKEWELWLDFALKLQESGELNLVKLVAHEERKVRMELSKLDRGRESPLSACDLVCFQLEALRVLLASEKGDAPSHPR